MMVSNSFLNERENHKYFIVVKSLCQVLPELLFELGSFCFSYGTRFGQSVWNEWHFWDVDINRGVWNIIHVSLISLCPIFPPAGCSRVHYF